jgi:ParB family transcriptional regulator, chromosome partitioning protein
MRIDVNRAARATDRAPFGRSPLAIRRPVADHPIGDHLITRLSNVHAMDKRPALGKGLSALIPDVPESPRASALDVDIDRLSPNAYQPRTQMDDARLQELARSIASNGIIQPILVREVGDRFEIIAGERRWRAAVLAGLHRVPVIVRFVEPGDERSLLLMALIENLQRDDLNPIDVARAYRKAADEFQLTQDEIAAAVGKDRATVANLLRLLKLPDDVRAEVAAGTLSMGHARALLALTGEADQRRMARNIIARSLSVRETESAVRKLTEGSSSASATAPPRPVDVHTRAAEDRLKLALGTRVRIVRRGTRGRVEIDFGSEEELIRIYEQLTERT